MWDPHDTLWEKGFTQIQQFVASHGHARVPGSYRTADGYPLGTWVGTRRTKREQQSPERQARLESLKGWVWDPYEAQWEEGFARLQQFVAKHGHTRMPAKHTTPDGFRLGMWVVKQ